MFSKIKSEPLSITVTHTITAVPALTLAVG